MEMSKCGDLVQRLEDRAAKLDTDIPSSLVSKESLFRRVNAHLNVSRALALRRVKSNSVFMNLPQLTSNK